MEQEEGWSGGREDRGMEQEGESRRGDGAGAGHKGFLNSYV